MTVDITALAAPVVELLRAIGTGRIPPGGPNAVLSASSSAIESARLAARAAADRMGQHWASAAADTAAAQAYTVHSYAVRVADNGDALAANLERAAAEVERCMKELAAILDHFVLEVGPWIPVLLTTPAGWPVVLESAADHIRQALSVVDRTRTELEAHKRALSDIMDGRTEADPEPEPEAESGPGPEAESGPAVTLRSGAVPGPDAGPTTPTPGPGSPIPAPDPGPLDTDPTGGVLPGDGLTPEQYRSRPLYPGGPVPDAHGQPGITGPIPPPGQQAPATPTPPAPATTTPAAPPPTPTATPPPTPAPTPGRLPDQPGVVGAPAPSAAEAESTKLPDQPGVIGAPAESGT